MGLATVMTALLLLDATLVETTAPQRRTFTAIWTDTGACAVDRRNVEAAVHAGLEPLGVSVRWKAGHGFEASGPETVRVVVLRSRKSALDPGTMGSANPGSASPTIWVQCDQVVRALGEAEGQVLIDRSRLGTAIGRVIAHEFVHLLVPGRRHDSTGLFAARLDGKTLVAPRTRLSEAFIRSFRVDSAGSPMPTDLRKAPAAAPDGRLPAVNAPE